MTFPTIAAGARANEAIGGYANFVAYCNALAAGVDSVTTTAAGAALKANNLSDLASASTARTNLGLGTMATATATDYLTKAGNLAGLADLPTARTNLGLGTAAVANTGTGASNVILGNDARLTDTRTPTAASIVDAMIATTLSPSKITGTAAILGTNTFTAQQFIDGSSDQIQQRIQGHSTQTSNLTTWENSSGSVLASISAAGAITGTSLRASSSTGALMLGTSGAQSDRRAITNTYCGYSNSYRAILLGSASTNYNITDGASTIAINYDPSINAWGGFSGDGGEMIVRRGLTVCVPNSGDTSFKKTMTWRDGFVGINQTAPTSGLQIQPPDAASIGLRVLGFAAQTASLQTWEDSSSTVLASVSAAGKGTFAGVTSTAGTFTSAVPALSVTGTMPTTGGTFVYGSDHVITSAGSAAHSQIALHSNLAAGYTGNRYTMGAWFENNAAGTGTSAWGGSFANYGLSAQAVAATTGHNVGQLGYASGGVLNIGFMGQAPTNKNSGVNVGVVGFGLNGGTSPTQVGGYFALTNGGTPPTLTSAALMADNVAQTSDIFVARDNGVNVFTIEDGGAVFLANMSAPGTPTGGGRIFVEGGALKFIGSAGTITTIATA